MECPFFKPKTPRLTYFLVVDKVLWGFIQQIIYYSKSNILKISSMTNGFLKGVKGVILDIDNTLLATNEFVLRNIKKTMERMNVSGTNLPALSDEQIISILAKNLPFEDIFKNLFTGELNGQPMAEAVLKDYRAFAPKENYIATPGALETVSWLNRQEILVALATNRVRLIEERLKQAGFTPDQFICICQPEAPELAKPHPKSLETSLNALKSHGVHKDEVIVLGDHSHDYTAANYQGMKFVAVLQGLTPADEFEKLGLHPSLIIPDLSLSAVQKTLPKAVEIEIYKNSLTQSAALTGRHAVIAYGLSEYFSEYALHKNRIRVEIEHLINLSEFFKGEVVPVLEEAEKETLRRLYRNFSPAEAYEVLQYDHLGRGGFGPLEHDAKSCEMWIREKIKGTSLEKLLPYVHLFLTSEDENNLAYKLMLSGAVNDLFVPKILEICEDLRRLAQKYQADPVLGRTHLQPASPTTFGKIYVGYLVRLTKGLDRLARVVLAGKINGAVGNYNTFVSAYPHLDWRGYSKKLVSSFGFETEMWTDQRGPHTDMVAAFQTIQEIGNVIHDLASDLCLYAGFNVMYFSKIESHVGSSVMPHKINPWWAEVAAGNIKKANYLINALTNELDISRLQRDLSDHDLERSYGEAFGYVLIAADHLATSLKLLHANPAAALDELHRHPEVMSEAIQTIMRVEGVADAFEMVKKAFRGVDVTFESLPQIIAGFPVDEKIKEKINQVLKPEGYTGLAEELTRDGLAFYDNFRMHLVRKFLQL